MPEACISCVIGQPIEHSLSPQIHTAGYQACGLSTTHVFTRYSVAPDQLVTFFAAIRTLQFRGVSVTLPHKAAVIPLLDTVDEAAKSLGAVNTIVNNDGVLCGSNTDWQGIVIPLLKRVPLYGKKVLVLGAGGAARAAIYGLQKEGAQVTVANRTEAKARVLAEEFSLPGATSLEKAAFANFDILVQTTSVGMAPNTSASLVPADVLHEQQIVFDCVYTPRETSLLRQARERGARTISGIEMFIEQGARQFELYTGIPAPVPAMLAALEDALYEN